VRFVDSHLHIDPAESSAFLSLAEATETLLLTCGVDRNTSNDALRLANSSRGMVRAFVGVHPSEAARETSLTWLRSALGRASGAGEIGLDPKYSPLEDGGAQMKAFVKQLEAAQAAGKPVQVHSRDAEIECIDTLGGFRLRGVLLHWFQGEGEVRRAQDSGYYVSFGPSLLYSKKLQRVAVQCSRALVLTETDSPVPYGPLGGVHGPIMVPSVVNRLSELWGASFEEARASIFGNAMRFLGLSEKG